MNVLCSNIIKHVTSHYTRRLLIGNIFGPNTELNAPSPLQNIMMKRSSDLLWRRASAAVDCDCPRGPPLRTNTTHLSCQSRATSLHVAQWPLRWFFKEPFQCEQRGIMWHLIWNQTGDTKRLLKSTRPAMHMEEGRYPQYCCPQICTDMRFMSSL